MTPRATVTATGWDGAIPVVPNPGEVDTAATGATGAADKVTVGAVVPKTGDAAPDTGGPAVAGADVTVDVADSAPVPQPASTVRTATSATTATTDEARQRNP